MFMPCALTWKLYQVIILLLIECLVELYGFGDGSLMKSAFLWRAFTSQCLCICGLSTNMLVWKPVLFQKTSVICEPTLEHQDQSNQLKIFADQPFMFLVANSRHQMMGPAVTETQKTRLLCVPTLEHQDQSKQLKISTDKPFTLLVVKSRLECFYLWSIDVYVWRPMLFSRSLLCH